MSERQNIVDKLIRLLQTIDEVDGDAVTFGNRVFPWKVDKVKVNQAPCLCIWDMDAECSFVDTIIGQRRHDVRIEIVPFVKPPFQLNTTRQIIDDIVTKIGSDYLLSGTLRTPVELVGHEIDNVVYGDVVAVGKITLRITYYTGLWAV